ncbi:hypothetical protein Pmani_007233 [Petrolisthes manimaculis]|uniref:Uncharacterized protein n=1 Tax=Petrolisthes manimaculis TaxID=1843537 RepID=A0AAE1QB01_9EUCA|nr:hypothetical protein Pmani_007233 [Petrolisthes manimaculis]
MVVEKELENVGWVSGRRSIAVKKRVSLGVWVRCLITLGCVMATAGTSLTHLFMLAQLPGDDAANLIHSAACLSSFSSSFTPTLIHSYSHSLLLSLLHSIPTLIHSYSHSLLLSLLHSIPTLIHSYSNSLLLSFTPTLTPTLIHSYSHSLLHVI